MMVSSVITLFAFVSAVISSPVSSIPRTATNLCKSGFQPGYDTTTVRLAYTYSQVVGVIDDFKNITWSGVPYNDVTLDGPDNTVGTSRTYSLAGTTAVEKLLQYSKLPYPGPYIEKHNLAQVDYAAANLSAYASAITDTVVPICSGKYSTFTISTAFCATNATKAQALFHQLHTSEAENVGVLLGGKTVTAC